MVVVVMGVAGAGKSTIGAALARALGWTFIDADDYHTREHIEVMRRGVALTDVERGPWLARVRDAMVAASAQAQPAVVACSALKRRYREALSRGVPDVRFVYLQMSDALMRERLGVREGHFAGLSLAASQIEALEPPGADEALTVDASLPPDDLVKAIRLGLGLASTSDAP